MFTATEEILSSTLAEFALWRAVPTQRELLQDLVKGQEVIDWDLRNAAGTVVMAMRDSTSELVFGVTEASRELDFALRHMSAAIENGFRSLTHLSTMQLEALREISGLLAAPVATQAAELRARALWAFESGLVAEAASDFNQVIELDPYDFQSHLHLGHVSLLGADPSAARRCYRRASKYAAAPGESGKPRSPFWAAMALVGEARACLELDEAQSAVDACVRASEVEPGRADVQFELARSAALANDDRATPALERALTLEPVAIYTLIKAEPDVPYPVQPIAEAEVEATTIQNDIVDQLAQCQVILEALGEPVIGGSHIASSVAAPTSDGQAEVPALALPEIVVSNGARMSELDADLARINELIDGARERKERAVENAARARPSDASPDPKEVRRRFSEIIRENQSFIVVAWIVVGFFVTAMVAASSDSEMNERTFQIGYALTGLLIGLVLLVVWAQLNSKYESHKSEYERAVMLHSNARAVAEKESAHYASLPHDQVRRVSRRYEEFRLRALAGLS